MSRFSWKPSGSMLMWLIILGLLLLAVIGNHRERIVLLQGSFRTMNTTNSSITTSNRNGGTAATSHREPPLSMIDWERYESLLHPERNASVLSCFLITNLVTQQPSNPQPQPQPQACRCKPPSDEPLPRPMEAWYAHFQQQVRDVQYAVATHQSVDVVLLGDSITERWNGTSNMGRHVIPEMRAVLDRHFATATNSNDNDTSNMLTPMVLATSADQPSHLLWRLQNGLLSSSSLFQPRLFWILIGTNDFGLEQCSVDYVLGNILRIVQYLQSQRPTTPILLHGLLPRQDGRTQGVSYTEPIGSLNERLRRFVEEQQQQRSNLVPLLYYMEANHVFWKDGGRANAGGTGGSMEINATRMEDLLHPSTEGLDAWAPLLVQRVQEILALH